LQTPPGKTPPENLFLKKPVKIVLFESQQYKAEMLTDGENNHV